MRQCAKIWTALGKLIRSQCNKGRIVDSLYFGSFGTESAARGMPSDPNGHYIYCPGPRSIFDLVENSDNMSQIDPNVSVSKYLTSLQVIDEKLVPVSFQAIAEVCNCGADLVQSVLAMIRDEIVNIATARKACIALRLPIGEILINQRQQIQFKSKTIAEIAKQTTASSNMRLTENNLAQLSQSNSRSQLDNEAFSRKSRQSMAERSINYMQKRQAVSQSGGSRFSRTNKKLASADRKRDMFDNDDQPYQDDIGAAPYFQRRMMSRGQTANAPATPNPVKKDIISRPGSRQIQTSESHEHLEDFIAKSIGSKACRSTKSSSSRRNNQLIEAAAKAKDGKDFIKLA